MTATLPPAAAQDRPSDFGNFWQHADALPRPASVIPEPEGNLASLQLTPEQQARRTRFRRVVAGIVSSLLAFTALATGISVLRGTATHSASQEVKPLTASAHVVEQARLAPPPALAQPAEIAPVTETERGLALARMPVATMDSLQTWSRLVTRFSATDRKRIEHDLSRSSVTGPAAAREAARLELAILWRATARRAKAQKVLVSLARTATDPLVKKYALDTLAAA